MGRYAISFDIKYDSAEAYRTRYDSLMAEITKCKKVWKETTSFAIVDTDETLDVLERRLYLSKFAPGTDILFVIDVGHDSCTIRGAAKQKTVLKELMPLLQEK